MNQTFNYLFPLDCHLKCILQFELLGLTNSAVCHRTLEKLEIKMLGRFGIGKKTNLPFKFVQTVTLQNHQAHSHMIRSLKWF